MVIGGASVDEMNATIEAAAAVVVAVVAAVYLLCQAVVVALGYTEGSEDDDEGTILFTLVMTEGAAADEMNAAMETGKGGTFVCPMFTMLLLTML